MSAKTYIFHISNISEKVRYDITQGEKRLLEQINSIVSHEMRNPLNAISTQKLIIESLIEKILDLFDDFGSDSLSDFIEQLKPLLAEQQDCLGVLSSSSNLLNFYVNDILDLAMINNGKFRKNCTNFNVQAAIEEIIQIQKHKADNLGIELVSEMEGFLDD